MKPLYRAPTSEKRDFAYELKFLVSREAAEGALTWARKNLLPDPFAGGETGDAYCVNSIYLDTQKLDVFYRVGSYGRCKYRVRRYGNDPNLFLERKLKTRGLVGKRRTRVPDHEITFLKQTSVHPGWIGFWFHRRLVARVLEPKCQIAYERVARVGTAPEGPIRLTLDRDLRSFPTADWNVKETGPWQPLLNGQCILEMKYRLSLPVLFKSIIHELGIQTQPISKYRLSVQAFGWDTQAQTTGGGPVNGEIKTFNLDQGQTQLWTDSMRRP